MATRTLYFALCGVMYEGMQPIGLFTSIEDARAEWMNTEHFNSNEWLELLELEIGDTSKWVATISYDDCGKMTDETRFEAQDAPAPVRR